MANTTPQVHAPASMTGAGSAILDEDLGRIEAEIRSVNHRFLKTTVRASGPLPPLDGAVEERVRGRVGRGHVTVHLRFTPSATTAGLDEEAFAAGARRLELLARTHGLGPPTVADVLSLPGVLGTGSSTSPPEAVHAAALQVLDEALAALARARRREGGRLAQEIRRLLGKIDEEVQVVSTRAGEIPEATRHRLQARLADLLEGSGVDPDPAWLAREVAVLADRSDVREEIARLEAHLLHAEEILSGPSPMGRRLDFLVQEMHREANTLGSKVADLDLARRVLAMKADVERLREQVQNLE